MVLTMLLAWQVRAVIEEQRAALGLERHQVLFNTDLIEGTSGTYHHKVSTAGREEEKPGLWSICSFTLPTYGLTCNFDKDIDWLLRGITA